MSSVINKDKIKNWMKDRTNLVFLTIVAFSILIRLYYFFLTKGQPLWWDEADYLAYAKNLAGFGVEWIVTAKHNSLYPFLVAILFKLGFQEMGAKFIFQIIPSILTVVLAGLIGFKMYTDKRVGIIASFVVAVFWVMMFNSVRFHVDVPAVFLGMLAIYIFWTGFEKNEKIFGVIDPKWSVYLAVLFTILSYSVRRGYFLFGIFFVVYLATTKKWSHLAKKKSNWFALGIAIILLFILESLIFTSSLSNVSEGYFHTENEIKFFLPFTVFNSYFALGSNLLSVSNIYFYLFWIGFALVLVNTAIFFDKLRKLEVNETKADFFNIISILVTVGFFIFVLRTPNVFGEPRWYLPLMFASSICIGKGAVLITDKIKEYNKQIASIVLVLLICLGGYYQLKHSDPLIENKLNSYSGIRDASLLIKQIAPESSIVITMGQPQVEFYSERRTVSAKTWTGVDPTDEVHFEKTLEKIRDTQDVDFILISFSEPGYPKWMKQIYSSDDGRMLSWEIPFTQSSVNFVTGEQKIEPLVKYEEYSLTFSLVDVKEEVFVYQIIRN